MAYTPGRLKFIGQSGELVVIVSTDELLGKEVDKNGNEIAIYCAKYENFSPAITAFFARQWAELLELNYATPNYIPDIKGSRVIFATNGSQFLGLRMWVWIESSKQKEARIILSSVDRNYRRLGIFEMITKYYDIRMIQNNCYKSTTFIYVNNTSMLAAARKTGYIVDQVRMIKNYNLGNEQ